MLPVNFLYNNSLFLWLSVLGAITTVISITVAIFIYLSGKKNLRNFKKVSDELLKKFEKNLSKAETNQSRTEEIINSLTDGLIVVDQENAIASINPEANRTLALGPYRLEGKSLDALDQFPRARPILEVLRSNMRVVHRKEVCLEKDMIVEVSVRPLGFLENSIGKLVIFHDISREKKVEGMKSEFVSLAAHQLRTPLSVIKWSLSMLSKGDFGKISIKQKVLVDRTLQNNDRLIALVNNLLNVTRIEDGYYANEFELSDILNVVNFVINSEKENLQNKKITLDFQKPDNIPLTKFDENKIKVVIQNFIDNAIKYSSEGGRIIISLTSDEKIIELKVQDFGMGIPKNQQDKVFTKFFSGYNATKENMNGSGLGLFISKNIIEAHGGTIWFTSDEKNGTIFHFSLPIIKKNDIKNAGK